jgi:uncharacterized protein YecT (DUF1311 family)
VAAALCDSLISSDQRTCLKNEIQRGDVSMSRVYRQLLAALRVQAGTEGSDPDPPSVVQARDAQTKWLSDRDAVCSNVGSGDAYARPRAQCYADQAARRIRELQEMINEIPKH